MLDKIESRIGNGVTDGQQITNEGKRLFGKKFKGIFAVKGAQGIPQLKNGEVAILNSDTHWYPVWNKHGKLYEGDSYNIKDRLGPKFIDQRNPNEFTQRPGEANCGPRSIVQAYFALKG